MPNPNPSPKGQFKQKGKEAVAESPIAVRLPLDLDYYVRSLPNRTEWLREAIAEKIERELAQAKEEGAQTAA